MDIEQATVDDVDDVVDCWVDLADDQQQHGSRLEAASNRKPATDTVARHIVMGGVLVARDELILGFVMFHTDEGTYSQRETTGEIVNLYVRPSVRNCGIGSELLAAAEAELASEGVETVTLDVLADNEAAKRFYEEHGYEPHRIALAKRIETNTHDEG
ncbi:MAG: acetyltransferase [Halonotius sp. J07HN6]|jgi:Acetyltransferases|nr:MAG: acetyltransferase [Halonotius sp. J07HN6]